MFSSNDQVRSDRFGIGRVVADNGATVVIRFEHGFEECEEASLRRLLTPEEAIERHEFHAPLDVITRCQAEAIQSINDSWGVFTRSRIALLPHQLWVCRQVIQSSPTRWLVADDVGLGKTIEAGLILLPLLARGDVKRLLVLCPASLTEQWQYRLRTMFDIRLTQYMPEADTPRSSFWEMHSQVVASLHTLRKDHKGRQERLLESSPWDMVVVDEAHHLNSDEKTGPTLGYHLLHRMEAERRVRSMVFFTGTPHRGKNHGFLALLKLLRSDLFDPQKPLHQQLPQLRQVMIRNNKQNTTDLKGRPLFQAPKVVPETYAYSTAESRFYDMLTQFILTGKAYASTLSAQDGRMVMLVMIAMQKLASSSVAAIRRAMRNRLQRIIDGRKKLEEFKTLREQLAEAEEDGDNDKLSQLDEQIAEMSAQVTLMGDEEPRLRELVEAAEQVTSETKIAKILSLLDGAFAGRQVLFFTEYKATQSLLMTALVHRYGAGCVTFINGDDRADEVVDAKGRLQVIHERRESAADKFNSGSVRFLVSTEAGGEGIDLQERCHSLIHVDLPWNPMRLHQRVGRLNRYGQTRKVEVFTIRNPDTVESRIWDKLNAKIGQITTALNQVMEEPEDLLQLVLGMTSSTMFHELFGEAPGVPVEKLAGWFDQKTTRFGGQDVLETVKALVGNAARFDFQEVSSQIPRMDLPDLKPFFVAMLELNRRRVAESDDGLSFKTPDVWCQEPGVRRDYAGLIFDRNLRVLDAAQRVLGVGHRLFDQALVQARGNPGCVTVLAPEALSGNVFVFKICDRVTSTGGNVRAIVAGVQSEKEGMRLLHDWELLQLLNATSNGRSLRKLATDLPLNAESNETLEVQNATETLTSGIGSLNAPFKIPSVSLIAAFLVGHRAVWAT